MKGIYLEDLTWPEAQAALERIGAVLIPVGARVKEHGLHLPLKTDWLTAEYLTRRVLVQREIIALPTVPYGYYPAFLDYPGSVHVRLEAFRDTIIDICISMARHGSERCYVLNTGISTNRALEPARLALGEKGVLMEYTDPTRLRRSLEATLAEQAEGSHADELETSALLYIAPEVVRLERARPDIPPRRGSGPFSRDPETMDGHFSPTGAWGDPTLATLHKGRTLVEAMVRDLVAEITTFLGQGFEPPPPRSQYL